MNQISACNAKNSVSTPKKAYKRILKGVTMLFFRIITPYKRRYYAFLALLRLLKGVNTQSLALLRPLKGVISQSLALLRLLKGVITPFFALLCLLKGVQTHLEMRNAFGNALLHFFGVITPFERRYYALFGIITPFERRYYAFFFALLCLLKGEQTDLQLIHVPSLTQSVVFQLADHML